MKTVKLTASQLRSLIAEETSRLTEAPRVAKRKPTSVGKPVQKMIESTITAIAEHISQNPELRALVKQRIAAEAQEIIQSGPRALEKVSMSYLRRQDWATPINRILRDEIAIILEEAIWDVRHPSSEE